MHTGMLRQATSKKEQKTSTHQHQHQLSQSSNDSTGHVIYRADLSAVPELNFS